MLCIFTIFSLLIHLKGICFTFMKYKKTKTCIFGIDGREINSGEKALKLDQHTS